VDAVTITMTREGEFDGISLTEEDVEVRERTDCHVANGEVQGYRVRFD
jgi:hypothetical protein